MTANMLSLPRNKRQVKGQSTVDESQIRTLEQLFRKELWELYKAELLFATHYTHLMKAAQCEDLQDHFFDGLQSNKTRIQRLENILRRMGQLDFPEEASPVAEAYIRNADLLCHNDNEGPVKDIQLIACALEGENFLISDYTTVTEFCETMGQYKMGELLDLSLAEKQNCSYELSELLRNSLERLHHQEESNGTVQNLVPFS